MLVAGHKLVIMVSAVIFKRGTPGSVWPCLMMTTHRSHWGRSKEKSKVTQSRINPKQRPPASRLVSGGQALRSKSDDPT